MPVFSLQLYCMLYPFVHKEMCNPILTCTLWSIILYISHWQKDTVVAEETRKSVQEEEAKASHKAKTASSIATDAQRDLDEALPALDAALTSLKSLNKNDVTEVRDFDDNGSRYSSKYTVLLVCRWNVKCFMASAGMFSAGPSNAASTPRSEVGYWSIVHHEGHQTQEGAWREARHQGWWLLGTWQGSTTGPWQVSGEPV